MVTNVVTNIEQFFTKSNQYFYYLKRVIFSCKTTQQLSQTLNWYTVVLNNLGKELDDLTYNHTVRNSTEYHKEFYRRCELLTEEINEHVNEVSNKPNNLVIKGFTYGN